MAKTGIVTRALCRVESWELVANGSFFLSLDTTPAGPCSTGAENLRGGLHAVTGSTGNDACGLSAGRAAVLEFLWSDESKRKFGRGHLNPSFGNDIALVPWDRLAGAGTCLDQSHCVVVAWLDWLQL